MPMTKLVPSQDYKERSGDVMICFKASKCLWTLTS